MVTVFLIVDDELLAVDGVSLLGMSVAQVGGVIRKCPLDFLAIIRPVSALRKYHHHHATNILGATYTPSVATVAPPTPPISPTAPHTNSSGLPINPSVTVSVSRPYSPPDSSGMHTASSEDNTSNDDMGDYDDEEDQP